MLRLSLLLKTFIFIILDIVFNNKIYTALHMVILLGLYGLIPFLIRVYMMITHGIVNGFEEGTEYIKIFSPPLTVQLLPCFLQMQKQWWRGRYFLHGLVKPIVLLNHLQGKITLIIQAFNKNNQYLLYLFYNIVAVTFTRGGISFN